MYVHRIETTIEPTGTLNLGILPFAPNDKVEVIILARETSANNEQPTISFAQAAKKFCGKIKHAPVDLSTNPAYLNGFGQ
ncbi:MAG: hypothetical protein GY862_22910 [Gammaproteobacteria bacterium]|nr:hypothetical protein [Gammaproteobacteria bacterium]